MNKPLRRSFLTSLFSNFLRSISQNITGQSLSEVQSQFNFNSVSKNEWKIFLLSSDKKAKHFQRLYKLTDYVASLSESEKLTGWPFYTSIYLFWVIILSSKHAFWFIRRVVLSTVIGYHNSMHLAFEKICFQRHTEFLLVFPKKACR